MATTKIKKDDLVKVIAGKDKGKEGKVLAVDTKNNKVLVEGVNIVKKHIKDNGQGNGGIIEVEAPIDRSNVSIIDPNTKKPTRIGHTMNKDKKIRIARRSKASLD